MDDNSIKLVDSGLARIDEGCRFLGISRAKLYEIMERGELPYVKIGRSRRLPRQALKEFAAQRLVGRAGAKDSP